MHVLRASSVMSKVGIPSGSIITILIAVCVSTITTIVFIFGIAALLFFFLGLFFMAFPIAILGSKDTVEYEALAARTRELTNSEKRRKFLRIESPAWPE